MVPLSSEIHDTNNLPVYYPRLERANGGNAAIRGDLLNLNDIEP